jgi:hypothetical protein
LSLSSFSQVDTTKTTLPNKILRLAAKDLVRYDGCKEELKLTQNKLEKVLQRESQKDTIISLYKDKDDNNKLIIHTQGLQISQYEKLSDDLHRDLKNEKTKSLFWKIGTYVGIITSTFLIITK